VAAAESRLCRITAGLAASAAKVLSSKLHWDIHELTMDVNFGVPRHATLFHLQCGELV
jgi:hypothetical protein